jgi:hypothetical protein
MEVSFVENGAFLLTGHFAARFTSLLWGMAQLVEWRTEHSLMAG